MKSCLQCFDTVGWATGNAINLKGSVLSNMAHLVQLDQAKTLSYCIEARHASVQSLVMQRSSGTVRFIALSSEKKFLSTFLAAMWVLRYNLQPT